MTESAQLSRPSFRLRQSYCALVAEIAAAGENFIPFVLGWDHQDFDAFLQRLDDCARGIGLPDGFVRHSTYWLLYGDDVVGVSNIRHALTDALRREGGNIGYGIRPSFRRRGFGTLILRRSLDQAAALGMDRVLLTCAKTNIASAKAILRSGGILQSEEFLPGRGEIVQRYWISTDAAV